MPRVGHLRTQPTRSTAVWQVELSGEQLRQWCRRLQRERGFLNRERLRRGAAMVAVRKSGVDDGGGVECSVKMKHREERKKNAKEA